MTAKEAITATRLRELMEYDQHTGQFTRRILLRGHAGHGSMNDGYRYLRVDGRQYRAHRLAWLYVYGEWPKHQIDHINGIRDDNRISNLRDVPHNINRQNQRAASKRKSGGLPLGVYMNQGRFQASIRVGKRVVFLGHFSTAEEAHEAYVAGKRIHHEGGTL